MLYTETDSPWTLYSKFSHFAISKSISKQTYLSLDLLFFSTNLWDLHLIPYILTHKPLILFIPQDQDQASLTYLGSLFRHNPVWNVTVMLWTPAVFIRDAISYCQGLLTLFKHEHQIGPKWRVSSWRAGGSKEVLCSSTIGPLLWILCWVIKWSKVFNINKM